MTLIDTLLILLISSIEIGATFLQLEGHMNTGNLFFLKIEITVLKVMISI